MDREFSMELSQREAQALNTFMPNGHSVQIFEKYERRKKAQKKLDDMYVAEFSLRPIKKVKKESEVTNEKNEHNHHSMIKKQGNDMNKQKSTNTNNAQSIKQLPSRQKQGIRGEKQKQVNRREKQKQQTQFRISRSQRVSRPTEAYMQFQEEAFKRKFTEKEEPVKVRDPEEGMKRRQECKHMRTGKEQFSKEIVKSQQNLKIAPKKGLDIIELKSLIAQKIQKRINKCEQLQKVKVGILEQKPPTPIQLKQQQQPPITSKDIQISIVNVQTHKDDKQQKEVVINQQQPHKQLNYQNQIMKVAKRQQQQPEYNNLVQVNQLPQQSSSLNRTGENNQQIEQMPSTRRTVQKQSDSLIENDINNNKKEHIKKVPKVVYNLSTNRQPTLTRAFRILQRLKTHKSSWPFRYPVDPVSQGVPDYLQKIKHPMDLRTIQKKLRNQKYKKEDEFFSDIQLMLNNSYSYNPQSSNYYILTCQLQTYFNQLKGKSYIPKSSVRNITNRKSDRVEEEYERQEDEGNQDQQELQELQEQNTAKKQDLAQEKYQLSSTKRPRPTDNSVRKQQQQLSKVLVDNNGSVKRGQQNRENNLQKLSKVSNNKISKVIDVNVLRSEETKERENISDSSRQYKRQQRQQAEVKNDSSDNKRIGYGQQSWLSVPIVSRECLLFDILNLKQQQSQQQLYYFITNNQLLINQLVVSRIHHVQQQEDIIADSQQQVQFELGTINIEGYKLLRQQVNKLIEKQRKVEQFNNRQQ